MRFDLRPLATLALVLLATAAQAGEGTRRQAGRLPCPQDAPEGARLPDRPDCAARNVHTPGRADGFRDVGGVRLRVGGRTSAEYGAAR